MTGGSGPLVCPNSYKGLLKQLTPADNLDMV
jgi:hypothetical protein